MNKVFSLFLAVLIAADVAPSRADTSDDPAIGLYSTQLTFPNGLRGELSITKVGGNWRAAIGGVEVMSPAATRMKFTFPNGGGELRVVQEANNARAFWITEPVFLTATREPGSATMPYASPLRLTAIPGGWRATVEPFPIRFTLHLKIYRDDKGKLVGAFRNPEYNMNGGFPLFSVARDGAKLRFTTSKEDAGRELNYEATLSGNRVAIFWPILGSTLNLERRTPEQLPDFFPRTSVPRPYIYRLPKATGDGWQVASAASVGFDEKALALAVQKIVDIDPASRRAWLIHSLAVARHGKLVLDEYFYGHDMDTPHDTRSAGKTFSAIMLGGIMLEGAKISPQTKAYELLAAMGPFANQDPRKAKITIGHLMTHSAGMACDDNDENSPYSEDKMQMQSAQPNWWKFSLDLPMAYEPGQHYAYCSGNINLVGAALTTASGTWLPELFDRTVAEPLQFGNWYWNLMPTNEGYLGGGSYVRTRDLLKIGQAYYNGGVWNGRRIATAAWTKESMSAQMRISPATTGRSGEDFTNVYYDTDEGFAWHIINVKSGDKLYPAIHGNGNGGQLVLIVPQFDLVVAFTAGNYGQGVWNRERDDITGDLIIKAIRN